MLSVISVEPALIFVVISFTCLCDLKEMTSLLAYETAYAKKTMKVAGHVEKYHPCRDKLVGVTFTASARMNVRVS